MGTRAPAASFALAVAILLGGMAFGVRSTSGQLEIAPVAPQTEQRAASVDVTVTQAAPALQPAAAPAHDGPRSRVTLAESLPTPKDAPAAVVFDDMKHVWQSLNNCGPAAVVMALSTFGVDASQEDARLALRGPDVRRGMGPQGVDAWVKENFGLRSMWRNDGTNDLMRRLVANGFVPMVTQWMQDPSISRVAHWRTVRGYDDAKGVFYVNDSMLGNMVPLSYDWFGRNWQSFSYRYMVIYRAQDEPLLHAVIGDDWSDTHVRQALYERARG